MYITDSRDNMETETVNSSRNRQLVEDTVRRIEAAQFLPHSGIRFPRNPCTTCPYVGLCLGRQELVDASLSRRQGEDLGWLDELDF